MKRIIALLITALLCIVTFSTCFSENGIIEPTQDVIYYVTRPNVKYVLESGEATTIHFGDKVTVERLEDNYAFIKTEDGNSGKVVVAFLAPINYPMIWLDNVGCYLSPTTELTPSDYLYGACGLRWEEKALILFEHDDYFFIVTDAGFSGYIKKDDPHISLYDGQTPSES